MIHGVQDLELKEAPHAVEDNQRVQDQNLDDDEVQIEANDENHAPPPPASVGNPAPISGLDEYSAGTAQRTAVEAYIKQAYERADE